LSRSYGPGQFPGNVLARIFLWPTIAAVICATAYTLRMLSFPHSGKDSWLEQGLYMLAFQAACLVVLLPWFIAMIGLNWTRLSGWRWRLLATILTLGIMAATVCLPEMLLLHLRH